MAEAKMQDAKRTSTAIATNKRGNQYLPPGAITPRNGKAVTGVGPNPISARRHGKPMARNRGKMMLRHGKTVTERLGSSMLRDELNGPRSQQAR